MKTRTRILLFVFSLLVLPAWFVGNLAYSWFFPRLINTEEGVDRIKKIFPFNNFTVLLAEGKLIHYVFKHYDRRDPYAGFDELDLELDGEKHMISDRDCGNRRLIIDGKELVVRNGIRLGTNGPPTEVPKGIIHPGLPAPIAPTK